MPAPIAMFAYKRLDSLQKVIEALELNDMAKETPVYVFVDGPKRETDVEKNQEVKQYLSEWKENAKFSEVTLIFSEKNKGLSKSIIEGVGRLMDEYGRAIVVEDDIVVTKDFLSFMNRSLDYYENDSRIWAVTGYTEPLPMLQEREYSTFPWYRCDCWGWASWKDRWELVDWNVSDYRQFMFSGRKRKKMNRGGEDMARMLDAQMVGAVDSWAIRWGYCASMLDKMWIHPNITRVMNIGFDGDGTNCGVKEQAEPLREMDVECKLLPSDNLTPELHKAYLYKVNHQYSTLSRIRKRVKSICRRIKWICHV